jgi:RimJ/RimL family protein N-acetyltransferase
VKHNIVLEGHGFRLRPVDEGDTDFILALRTDPHFSRFLHPTPPDPAAHLRWLASYYERQGDYYFIVENPRNGKPEGTIGVYSLDAEKSTAEWGRWLIKPGSLAALESAWLIYRVAFEVLHLDSVYCHTLMNNDKVLGFHDASGAKRAPELVDCPELNNKYVEHRILNSEWSACGPLLEKKAQRLASALTR